MAGVSQLAVYAVGLGVPFIVAAMFIGPFMRWMRKFRRHLGTVEKVMGIMLILVGGMMITGDFSAMAYWLVETFPVLSELG
jgi:cytochrome c-type biogenesis protein